MNNDPFIGSINDPVTIVEYGDFGCPSCRAWHNEGIFEQVQVVYGDQVRFVWQDFPVITAQSPKAAEAAQCAYDQGYFLEYHSVLRFLASRCYIFIVFSIDIAKDFISANLNAL